MLGEGKSGLVEGGWVNKINLLSLLQDFSETLKVQWLLCISKIAYAPFASVSGPELILLLIPPLPMDPHAAYCLSRLSEMLGEQT